MYGNPIFFNPNVDSGIDSGGNNGELSDGVKWRWGDVVDLFKV
jgi:hypothetical protein